MCSNKFNPFLMLESLYLKLTILIQILGKLPDSKYELRKCRNFVKDLLLQEKKIMPSRPFSDFLDDANLFFKKELDNLLRTTFRDQKPKILIISHDFSLTGAPKASLMLAKTIKEIFENSPLTLSLNSGPIENEFKKENLPFLYYNQLPFIEATFLDFFNEFDLIIANSLVFDFFIDVKKTKTPIIWWSHEIFTSKRDIKKIKSFMPNLFSFWGGSPLTQKILKDIEPNKKNELMLYGLPEVDLPTIQKDNDKIVFSLMGTWDKRKRQDLFVAAIKLLPMEIRSKAVFNIIGDQTDKKYSSKIIDEIRDISQINIIPQQSFDELLVQYAKSDVIISTSDFDPMPIVVTYGLMFKKLCLCSDAIGIALLIENNKNGLLFKAGDASDLSAKLSDIILNYDTYNEISEKGYEVYKNNFSQELFKSNLKKHIDEVLEYSQEQEKKSKHIENKFKISIITASYNYAHFISKTINSVINQSYDNWELIIVDDGSKDNSIEVISQFLSNPKIKLVQHENGENRGLKETVKLGVKHVTGDYVAFLESDDYWHEDYLFEKVKMVNETPNAALISNDIELFGETFAVLEKECYINHCKNILTLDRFNQKEEMKKSNLCPTFSSTMIKTDVLRKLNFETPVQPWLDWWLWKQAFELVGKIYFVNKKLTYWQIHSKSYNQGVEYSPNAKLMNKEIKRLNLR